MKKIFIDASSIVNKPTGVGKYCYFLLEGLCNLKQDRCSFTVLHQKDLAKDHPLFLLKKNNVNLLSAKISVVGPNHDLYVYKKRKIINDYDILHCLHGYFPAFGIKIPSIVTIHDLAYLLFPDMFNNVFKILYYKWIISRSINKSNHIIAVSNSTKRDLVKLGLPPNKISVIHEAAALPSSFNTFKEDPPDGLNDEPYLLYVGVNRPHKNIKFLIKAYETLKKILRNKYPTLVIVGPGFETVEREYRMRSSDNKLRILGSVTDSTLVKLYKNALALLYPSLYEGFGLPVLEAMTLGTPVIASRCSSIPEVAGDAALLIDPKSVDEFVRAMLKIVNNAKEREQLSILGLKHAQEFTWEKTARMTLDLYEKYLD